MAAVARAGQAVHQAEISEPVLFLLQQAGTGGKVRNMPAHHGQDIEHVLQFAYAHGRQIFHAAAVADAPQRARGQGQGREDVTVQDQDEDAENQDNEHARKVKDEMRAPGRFADVFHGPVGCFRLLRRGEVAQFP